MVDVAGSPLSKISFEEIADALQKDPKFRESLIKHLTEKHGAQIQPGRTVDPAIQALLKGNSVTIETKANFELDESRVFDLNGKGLTVSVVAVN